MIEYTYFRIKKTTRNRALKHANKNESWDAFLNRMMKEYERKK